jgi:hypothetical protein
MVHCGYDPSGALGTNYQRGDNWKNFSYNFGAKPRPYRNGARVQAFNGVSIGKGHLAEARTDINTGLAGAKSAFQRGSVAEHEAATAGNGAVHASTFCGTGDTSERDELLTKIAESKKAR